MLFYMKEIKLILSWTIYAQFVDNKLIIIFEFLREMYKHKSIASNSFPYLESFHHKDKRINQERE